MDNKILDEIILGLADEFEASNRHPRTFEPSSREEFEPLRECLASLIAEGSLSEFQKMRCYLLTPTGYLKYKSRVDALRVLSR